MFDSWTSIREALEKDPKSVPLEIREKYEARVENAKLFFAMPPTSFLRLPLGHFAKGQLHVDSMAMHYFFGDEDAPSSFLNEPSDLWLRIRRTANAELPQRGLEEALQRILRRPDCKGIDSTAHLRCLVFRYHIAIGISYFRYLFESPNHKTSSRSINDIAVMQGLKDLAFDMDWADHSYLHWALGNSMDYPIDMSYLGDLNRIKSVLDPVRESLDLTSAYARKDGAHPILLYAFVKRLEWTLRENLHEIEHEIFTRLSDGSQITSDSEGSSKKRRRAMRSMTNREHELLRLHWLEHVKNFSLRQQIESRISWVEESKEGTLTTAKLQVFNRFKMACDSSGSPRTENDSFGYSHHGPMPISKKHFTDSDGLLNRIRDIAGKPPIPQ